MTKIVTKSILFLFGLTDNPISRGSVKSDEECLRADWQAVGNDLTWAMKNYEKR